MTRHRPRKRFGQHFLRAPDAIERIVAAIAPQRGDTIVEIGPGTGAITAPLVAAGVCLHAIEFDRDLAAALSRRYEGETRVSIHPADALDFDFSSLGERLRVVGNLPYNISTPLLFHLLEHGGAIRDMHFMLQREVVERISAAPGNKQYGRLTIMLGCRLESVPLFDVPPSAFDPPPKVMSSVVRLRPLPPPGFGVADAALLARIVRQAFTRRRKTLRNALAGVADEADIEAARLLPGLRPEQVAIDGWVRLANHLAVTN